METRKVRREKMDYDRKKGAQKGDKKVLMNLAVFDSSGVRWSLKVRGEWI